MFPANGVADFTCNGGLDYCTDVSTKFDNLVAGEYVCMKGSKYNHSGVCIEPATSTKRGKMFEDTTGWGTKRAIISEFDIYGNRYYNGVKNVAKWTYHGKLQWVDYKAEPKPKTQVMIWQEKMNEQWNCGLEIDGRFGPLCTKAGMAHQLYYGVKAPIMVKWLQNRLNQLGYSLDVDGSCGPKTVAAIKSFQKKKHLSVDGYCGSATYKALTE